MKLEPTGDLPRVPTIQCDVPFSRNIFMHIAVDPTIPEVTAHKRITVAIKALTARGHREIILWANGETYKITKEENHG